MTGASDDERTVDGAEEYDDADEDWETPVHPRQHADEQTKTTTNDAATVADDLKRLCVDEDDLKRQKERESAWLSQPELVALHARRKDSHLLPPPPPLSSPPSLPASPSISLSKCIGTRAVIEAQRRVRAFLEREREDEQRLRSEESSKLLLKKQVRRQHKAFHQRIGVADISPQQRLVELKRRDKMERRRAKQRELEARNNRWYNKVKRTTTSQRNAADFGAKVLEDARSEARQQAQRKRQQQRVTQQRLAQLRMQAQQIVARCSGEYERGSYLLKKGSTTVKSAGSQALESQRHHQAVRVQNLVIHRTSTFTAHFNQNDRLDRHEIS
ncbi:hypothetical protein PINS_up013461 [Pythium insidiosum]|nr:hypothetical protein PINS_up013461 [Pythium insidiosum]